MRRHDNATPAGIFLGDDGPRTWLPGDAPCCRDGYARLSLVRPFTWVRPDPPTSHEYLAQEYRLCPRCAIRRLERGAHFNPARGYNPHLAY